VGLSSVAETIRGGISYWGRSQRGVDRKASGMNGEKDRSRMRKDKKSKSGKR